MARREQALLMIGGIAAGAIAFAATLPRASVRVGPAPDEPPPARVVAPVESCCDAAEPAKPRSP